MAVGICDICGAMCEAGGKVVQIRYSTLVDRMLACVRCQDVLRRPAWPGAIAPSLLQGVKLAVRTAVEQAIEDHRNRAAAAAKEA